MNNNYILKHNLQIWLNIYHQYLLYQLFLKIYEMDARSYSVASSQNPIKYLDPDGREVSKKSIENIGTGTLKDPFVQKNTTSKETDAFKSLSIVNYKAYKNNGKIFEQYME